MHPIFDGEIDVFRWLGKTATTVPGHVTVDFLRSEPGAQNHLLTADSRLAYLPFFAKQIATTVETGEDPRGL